MNFSNFTKTSSGNLIYLKNKIPIENAGSIKFYKDDSSGNFLKKEMRWSFDRNHWASWMDLSIKNIAGIKTADNKYLFFEIKYTMTSPTAGRVSIFSIEYLLNTGQTFIPPIKDVSLDHNHTIPNGCDDPGKIVKEIIKVTDAQTLCGKSCDFYLWRSNQKGKQSIASIIDLQEILDDKQPLASYILDTSTRNNLSWNNGYLDVSIPGGTYLQESSIGTGFVWDNGYLNAFIFVDGSLLARDIYSGVQDASIISKVSKSGDTMAGGLIINASLNVSGISYFGNDVSIGSELFVHGAGGASVDSSFGVLGDVSIGGSIRIINNASIGSNLPYAQFDASNGNKLVTKGGYYGQEFFYEVSSGITSTSSITPNSVLRQKLTVGPLSGGIYKISNYYNFSMGAINQNFSSSLLIDDISVGIYDIEKVNTANTDKIDRFRTHYASLTPGIHTISQAYWTSNAGAPASINESSLEIIKVK
jgi:hypothetical protein